MSATASPYGLVPVYHPSGLDRATAYTINPTYNTAIYKGDPVILNANGVQDAMTTGVRFVACGNSMQSMKLTRDDLVDGVAHARAGYVEIMRLQKLGYAYIRP